MPSEEMQCDMFSKAEVMNMLTTTSYIVENGPTGRGISFQ